MQEMREEEIVGQVVVVVTVMKDDGLILNASIAKKKPTTCSNINSDFTVEIKSDMKRKKSTC